jgi:CheY-like chemotaxis protein
MKILIVDDNEGIRTLLSDIFRRAGFEARTAANAQEAIGLCQGECFDVLLSDVLMPGTDGHELARRVAVLCPPTRVILMSAYDPGCNHCPYAPRCPLIRKPFSARQIVGCVSGILASPPPGFGGPL